MAKRILAVSPHASNPVSSIAYLIHAALQQRIECSADSYAEYQQTLGTLVGLGFTAILSEGSRAESCQPHFNLFLRCREVVNHRDNLEIVSVSIAEIICNAIYPFSRLGHPNYYHDFIETLMVLLKSSSPDKPDTEKGISVIMQELFDQCH